MLAIHFYHTEFIKKILHHILPLHSGFLTSPDKDVEMTYLNSETSINDL